MSDSVLSDFQQQEAKNIAQSVLFNRWSRIMIRVLIQEQEKKLTDSDLPVEEGRPDDFWTGVA